MREVQELTHARLEPVIVGFQGLFTARTTGMDALDVRYQLGEVELRMLAAHRPRPADLMLLAALVALAGPAGRQPVEATDGGLIGALEAQPVEAAQGSIIVRTTRARLLSECGLTDAGTTREQLRESLTRLASLTAIARRARQEVSMHLLSYTSDEDTGELVVALSPRLANAIFGGRHVRLELREMRELGEHARVLYARLCAWINPCASRPRRIGLAALVGYLWPEDTQLAAAGRRKRRHLTRRAMAELSALAGWRVWADARGVQYTITRPAVVSRTPAVESGTPAVVSRTRESTISA